uniref:Uncharacterized protein n=1 Tax=Anguilla anguilla TaxID=7936 RepID=A0A0E9XBT2_ANGAN
MNKITAIVTLDNLQQSLNRCFLFVHRFPKDK